MEQFIRNHAEDIAMFHVKDGEFIATAESDAYGSFLPWSERPGCFRSTGDGQIDYQRIFDLLGRELKLGLWATVEWEDCRGKGWTQGTREAVHFVNAWLNQTPPPAKTMPEASGETFDDFVGGGEANPVLLAEILGISVDQVNTEEPAA
ncbi:MAG: AP endonuclease family 2 protein [Candidatus Peregrinibacteria bacterium GW2011_GWA2_54_9]|nr:MAG: AP endonuclease family 2 protein [Candidatus Peregrinibacteria bacterium GW2011_GWA2_54_9]